MNELKVRAWYKISEEMATVNEIDFVNKTVTIDWADVGYDEDGTDFPINELIVDFENIDLIRYTGRHDKTGKELWEGDIYTDPNWPRKPLEVEWVDDLYDDNGSYYSGWSVAIPEDGINESIYGPTKIGNIWQNPELISGGPDES